MPKYCFHRWVILLTASCCLAQAQLQKDSAQTANEIADYLLGKTTVTGDAETALIESLDQNGDHRLTVADLVRLDKSGVPFASFAGEVGSDNLVVPGSIVSTSVSEGVVVKLRVEFSVPITDTLKIHTAGTAASGADFTVPSTIAVSNASSVDIPVTIVNDSALPGASGEAGSETIEIIIDQGTKYLVGEPGTYLLYIQDNDAIWDGLMEIRGAQLHFMMKIAQSNAAASATVTSDGYGIIPAGVNGVDWPVTGVTLSDAKFAATFADIPVGDEESLIGVDFKRTFALNADEANGGEVDRSAIIRGSVTEQLASVASKDSYLNSTKAGKFTLTRRSATLIKDNPTLTTQPYLKVIIPNTGGSTPVKITGEELSTATGVTFDGIAGTSFSKVIENGKTAVRVTPPQHASGPAIVRVVVPGKTLNALTYTYAP